MLSTEVTPRPLLSCIRQSGPDIRGQKLKEGLYNVVVSSTYAGLQIGVTDLKSEGLLGSGLDLGILSATCPMQAPWLMSIAIAPGKFHQGYK